MLVRGYLVSYDEAARTLGMPEPDPNVDHDFTRVGVRFVQLVEERKGLEELVRWPDYLLVSSRGRFLVVTEYAPYSAYRFVDVDKYDQSKLPQREENEHDKEIKAAVLDGRQVDLPFVTCYKDDRSVTPKSLVPKGCVVDSSLLRP